MGVPRFHESTLWVTVAYRFLVISVNLLVALLKEDTSAKAGHN